MARTLPVASLMLGVASATGACGPSEPLARPERPAVEVITRARSPSGRREATAYTLIGGGAAGYVLYRVALGAPGRDQSRLGPADVAQLRHAHPLSLVWRGDSTLVVQHAPDADVDTVVAERAGVRVRLAGRAGPAPR